jgi:hypothetical protein
LTCPAAWHCLVVSGLLAVSRDPGPGIGPGDRPTALAIGRLVDWSSMRIAVISDVHSNVVALDAVLAHVGGVDALWHLGDIVGYGPDPDAVVERLADAGAIGVRGNHDAAAVGGDEIEWFNADARAAMEWTRRAIAPSTLAWLRALPERRVEADFTLVTVAA